MVADMLQEEGATWLFDAAKKPFLVGRYYFDEPIELTRSMVDGTTCVLQFSRCEQFEGDDPPEDTWEDLHDATVIARYWRMWSGPPAALQD
jgi:hypothetical protein